MTPGFPGCFSVDEAPDASRFCVRGGSGGRARRAGAVGAKRRSQNPRAELDAVTGSWHADPAPIRGNGAVPFSPPSSNRDCASSLASRPSTRPSRRCHEESPVFTWLVMALRSRLDPEIPDLSFLRRPSPKPTRRLPSSALSPCRSDKRPSSPPTR